MNPMDLIHWALKGYDDKDVYIDGGLASVTVREGGSQTKLVIPAADLSMPKQKFKRYINDAIQKGLEADEEWAGLVEVLSDEADPAETPVEEDGGVVQDDPDSVSL